MNKTSVVNHRDRDGRTPLSHACQRGDLEQVKTLVRNNADPEVVDAWGNTAVMYAAAGGHSPVVEFLVRAFKRMGVQLDRQNQTGDSAAEVARIMGHGEGVWKTRRGAREDGKLDLVEILKTSGRSRRNRLPSMGSIEEVETEGVPQSTPRTRRTPSELTLPPLVQNKSVPSPRLKDPSKSSLVSGPGGSEVLKPPPTHRTFSVFGTKLLRRFTAPDLKQDVRGLQRDPGSVRIPRSETFPVSARHPQVDSRVSVDSISSVTCEFDFHWSKC